MRSKPLARAPSAKRPSNNTSMWISAMLSIAARAAALMYGSTRGIWFSSRIRSTSFAWLRTRSRSHWASSRTAASKSPFLYPCQQIRVGGRRGVPRAGLRLCQRAVANGRQDHDCEEQHDDNAHEIAPWSRARRSCCRADYTRLNLSSPHIPRPRFHVDRAALHAHCERVPALGVDAGRFVPNQVAILEIREDAEEHRLER